MNRMTRDKAMQYAKYRLPFSPEASKYVIDIADVSQGVVADIGAGTGLLTKHFVGNVKKVFGIEPDYEMREHAKELIREREDVEFQDGLAENTNLLTQSIDLIIAANAYHRWNVSCFFIL